ncbi:SpoIIE family protein phosphatase [Streptomyces sp. NPDC049577]|uniref:PP2C family protein-serine/threonine phosphatase n=1 Tax=Streptomyces sp. NPDC049577 TaxID=3155153 RepID=UPI003423BC7A
MPSPLSAEPSATEPPQPGTVDTLISRTRRLRGDLDAVRREAAAEAERWDDPGTRWQRALCELAVRHADGLHEQLGLLRDGLSPEPEPAPPDAPPAPVVTAGPDPDAAAGTAGSAEWNLLTDEVTWSGELFELFGRRPEDGALTLDELPSWLPEEDRELLTALVTDCLVDGRPIDGEFRIVRPDGRVRTVHMLGEPLLDAEGCTASLWAVVRDVSELRRSRQAVHETHDAVRRRRRQERTERRVATELHEAVLPRWRGSLRLPPAGPSGVPALPRAAARSGPPAREPAPAGSGGSAVDVAGHYVPSGSGSPLGGDWFDAMPLPDERTLLSVGGLTGHGVAAASGMAMLVGAVRGMAVSGTEPGPLMGWLNHLLDTSAQPALGSAVCCRYDPRSRTLLWARAGGPAPLLFRDGTARVLRPPAGTPDMPLGAVADADYAQTEERLLPGDVLLLHTDGLADTGRLPELAPRFAAASGAQECVRAVLEECGGEGRLDDACVLIARIG